VSNRSCPHYPRGIKNAPITCRFGFVFEEDSVRDTCMIIETGHRFPQPRSQGPLFSSLEGGRERTLGTSNLVPRGKPWERGWGTRSTGKRNASVFKFFRLKSVFEKLRFRNGLVWAVVPTVEIKLAFLNSSGGRQNIKGFLSCLV